MQLPVFRIKMLSAFNILSFVILFIVLVLIFFNVNKLSSPLILHYDYFKGVDLFGKPQDLWGILAGSLTIVLINIFLGKAFFKKESLLTYLFYGVNILIAVLTLVVVGNIISVN